LISCANTVDALSNAMIRQLKSTPGLLIYPEISRDKPEDFVKDVVGSDFQTVRDSYITKPTVLRIVNSQAGRNPGLRLFQALDCETPAATKLRAYRKVHMVREPVQRRGLCRRCMVMTVDEVSDKKAHSRT
jgi:hypothetical protein